MHDPMTKAERQFNEMFPMRPETAAAELRTELERGAFSPYDSARIREVLRQLDEAHALFGAKRGVS